MRCHSANKQMQGTKTTEFTGLYNIELEKDVYFFYNAYHFRFQIAVTKRLQTKGDWQVTVDAACNARKATINEKVD